MSKNNANYRAANGSPIKNHGKRSLAAYNDYWTPFKIEAQVADVSTPLASVYQMCRSGNTVVFNAKGGTDINRSTGKRFPIDQRSGAYEINMWVPASKEVINEIDKQGSREEPISRGSGIHHDGFHQAGLAPISPPEDHMAQAWGHSIKPFEQDEEGRWREPSKRKVSGSQNCPLRKRLMNT